MDLKASNGFARGVFEAFGTIALFVGGGLALAATLPGGAAGPNVGPALYPPPVEQTEPAPRVFLVDGYNVLNVGLLAGREREGWWSSRFRGELLGRVEAFEEREAEIWVVFDGATPGGGDSSGRVRSVFAPSADDWLLERLRQRGAEHVTVVTADRRLAARARHRGAEVVAPAWFLARCPELG
jgi:predicted RNA-binding protein with PIN domain